MSNVIKDGTGSGFVAKVGIGNRLHVDSVQKTQSQESIIAGNGYNLNTGIITLTSDSESAIMYIKYNGDNTLIIKEVLFIIGETTGGASQGILKVYKNPTSGTIVSGASNFTTVVNRNFASSNELDTLNYKGTEGSTLTDGNIFVSTSRGTFTATVALDADIIVLGKGNSIGATWQPPSGNTSQTIVVALTCFEIEEDN